MPEQPFHITQDTRAYLVVRDANGAEHEIPCDYLTLAPDDAFRRGPLMPTFRIRVDSVIARNPDGSQYAFVYPDGVSVETSTRPRQRHDEHPTPATLGWPLPWSRSVENRAG